MTCDVCGRTAEPDRETGYDADRICPACAFDGWTEDEHGQIYREVERVREIVAGVKTLDKKADMENLRCQS